MTAALGGMVALFGHDPATYIPHPVHDGSHVYHETDCYTDIVIELLHARGDEPLAALASFVRGDFEGDQFTFFKPWPSDLETLFGVDIHEMQPYRPLPDQIAELLGSGRTAIVELDAWYLPDTFATSYRTEHVKTSVAAEAIDPERGVFRYYHNTSLHELGGDDFRGAFRIGLDLPGDVLPPYTEIVRFDAGPRLTGAAVRAEARRQLRYHLDRRPATDPFTRFGERLAADMPTLLDGDDAGYHAYAFATVRMAGAGFELCAAHVDWLLGADGAPTVAAFGRIVDGSKTLGFRLARRRPFDVESAIGPLSEAWHEAMATLDRALA